MILNDVYDTASEDKKPAVLSYSGFLIIRLFDLLWEKQGLDFDDIFVDPIEKEQRESATIKVIIVVIRYKV